MAVITVVASGSAVAPFAAVRQDTQSYQSVVFATDVLTTDTITVKIVLPSEVAVPAFTLNGAAAVLTSALQSVNLAGGPTYTFVKSATTDTVGLYMIPNMDDGSQ